MKCTSRMQQTVLNGEALYTSLKEKTKKKITINDRIPKVYDRATKNVVIHTEVQRRICGLCAGLFHSAWNSRQMVDRVINL